MGKKIRIKQRKKLDPRLPRTRKEERTSKKTDGRRRERGRTQRNERKFEMDPENLEHRKNEKQKMTKPRKNGKRPSQQLKKRIPSQKRKRMKKKRKARQKKATVVGRLKPRKRK